MLKVRSRLAAATILAVTLGAPNIANAQAEVALVGAAAVAKEAYGYYQFVIQVLQSGDPTPQDKIIAQLAALNTEIGGLGQTLQQLDSQLAELVRQEQQDEYRRTLQQAQASMALAQTAAQQLQEWQQTGRSDTGKLENAENNSQLAANQLRQEALYIRPGTTASDPDTFDYRPALAPYLYALSVRLAVVAGSQPDFRRLSAFTNEFVTHLKFAEQLPARIGGNIQCQSLKQVSTSGGATNFAISSFCTDMLSKFESRINGFPPNGFNPHITNFFAGGDDQAANALGYFSFYDRWHVEDAMGIHAVQSLLGPLRTAATPVGIGGGPIPVGGQDHRAQTATFDGCLSISGFGLAVSACGKPPGFDTQKWILPKPGAQGTVSLADGSACLEVSLWDASFRPEIQNCSGSPGEKWTRTEDNQLQWARNQSVCLTSRQQGSLALTQCGTNLNSQRWIPVVQFCINCLLPHL